MTTPKSAEREAFESWAKTNRMRYPAEAFDFTDGVDNDYPHSRWLQMDWEVWQARAALAQPAPAAEVPTPGLWHDWSGGECPVAGEVWVDVKISDGHETKQHARDVYWGTHPYVPTIIAWRYAAVTPVPQPEQTAEPLIDGYPLWSGIPQPEQTSSEEYWGRPGKRLDDALAQLEGVRQSVKELEAEYAQLEQTADLHGAVMNIPSESKAHKYSLDTAGLYAYKLGHRDARHAAAELVAQQSNAPALTTKLVEWAEEAVEYVNNPAMSPSLEREGRRLLAAQGSKT